MALSGFFADVGKQVIKTKKNDNLKNFLYLLHKIKLQKSNKSRKYEKYKKLL